MVAHEHLSPAAAAEWMRHADGILRGVGHALNNRAAAIGALVDLADHGDGVGSTRALAAEESQRLAAIASAIRSVSEAETPVQAFIAADAARDAATILAIHKDFRGAPPAIEADGATAVRTRRGVFVRALIALAGVLPPGEPAAITPIVLRPDGDWLVVSAAGARAAASPLVMELARAMEGEPLDDGYGFRVPSLALLRRREGR